MAKSATKQAEATRPVWNGKTPEENGDISQEMETQQPAEIKQAKEPPRIVNAIIEIPRALVAQTTWAVHINTRLSAGQTNALRSVTAALDQRQATLANGKRVVNPADAIKYLLEQIASEKLS